MDEIETFIAGLQSTSNVIDWGLCASHFDPQIGLIPSADSIVSNEDYHPLDGVDFTHMPCELDPSAFWPMPTLNSPDIWSACFNELTPPPPAVHAPASPVRAVSLSPQLRMRQILPKPEPHPVRYSPDPRSSSIASVGASPRVHTDSRAPAPPCADDAEGAPDLPGRAIYSPHTGERIGAAQHVVLPVCLPPAKKAFRRGTPVACLFCRKRKIACGGPRAGSADKTCSQCARRGLACEYPATSLRGIRFKETQDVNANMIIFSPLSPDAQT